MFGVGIIGCGAISGPHLDAIKAYPHGSLVGVCDIDVDKAKHIVSIHGGRVFESIDQMCLSDEVGVIHILLPHDLHVETAVTCLEAGKHVVLEKPVGISMEELKRLDQVAKSSKASIGVTLQNRFNPSVLAIKEALDREDFGPLLGARSNLYWYRDEAYYKDSDWRGIKEREGGGLLINQAIHTLDLMQFIGGDMEALQAKVANLDHSYNDVEDMAMIEFSYRNGAKGFFMGTNNYVRNEDIHMIFDFEKASFLIENHTAYEIRDGQKRVLTVDSTKPGEKGYWGKGHSDCIHHIYEAFFQGKALKATLKAALEATELVLGCYESHLSGKPYLLKDWD